MSIQKPGQTTIDYGAVTITHCNAVKLERTCRPNWHWQIYVCTVATRDMLRLLYKLQELFESTVFYISQEFLDFPNMSSVSGWIWEIPVWDDAHDSSSFSMWWKLQHYSYGLHSGDKCSLRKQHSKFQDSGFRIANWRLISRPAYWLSDNCGTVITYTCVVCNLFRYKSQSSERRAAAAWIIVAAFSSVHSQYIHI